MSLHDPAEIDAAQVGFSAGFLVGVILTAAVGLVIVWTAPERVVACVPVSAALDGPRPPLKWP